MQHPGMLRALSRKQKRDAHLGTAGLESDSRFDSHGSAPSIKPAAVRSRIGAGQFLAYSLKAKPEEGVSTRMSTGAARPLAQPHRALAMAAGMGLSA